jgi:cysteinyl-tRNA synthetase
LTDTPALAAKGQLDALLVLRLALRGAEDFAAADGVLDELHQAGVGVNDADKTWRGDWLEVVPRAPAIGATVAG